MTRPTAPLTLTLLFLAAGPAFAQDAPAPDTPASGAGENGEAPPEGMNERADAEIVRAFQGAAEEETIAVDTSAYADFLSTYLEADPEGLNRFRYGEVAEADHEALKAAIAEFEAVDWQALTEDQKFAFFTNLYNAVTLDVVLDHYPVDSIRDISIEEEDAGLFSAIAGAFSPGPWSADLVTVGGVDLSLDDIEHSILRPMGDPRVHYAVNCASIGCPDLLPTPFSAETLDADLDAAATAYLATDRGMREGSTSGGLLVSSIYDWFVADFGGTREGVIAHLREHAPEDRAALLGEDSEIIGYRYDWDINDMDAEAP